MIILFIEDSYLVQSFYTHLVLFLLVYTSYALRNALMGTRHAPNIDSTVTCVTILQSPTPNLTLLDNNLFVYRGPLCKTRGRLFVFLRNTATTLSRTVALPLAPTRSV